MRQWKFALIVIYIVPLVLITIGVGVLFLSKYHKKYVDELAAAATVAAEVISSIRTVQAYSSQEKLSKLYDDNLVGAERWGFKTQTVAAFMIASTYFTLYASYGFGFCILFYDFTIKNQGKDLD